jgi:hypothetical protein
VTVASLESLKDGSANLTRLGLPCTKTQLTENNVLAMCIAGHWVGLFRYSRDGVAAVESNLPAERHDC